MKNKRIIIKILSLAMMLVCVFALLMGTSSAYSIDYSKPGSTDKKTLDAVALVKLITGEELSELEIEHLTLNGDFSLSYITAIGTSNVTTVYDKYDKTLVVTASKYSYVSEDGTTVIWIPKSVSLRGGEPERLSPNGTVYTKTFTGVFEQEDNSVSVIYSASIVIPKDVVNNLLNLTYNEAQKHKNTIAEKEREYEEALDKYNKDSERYDDYIEALSEYEILKAEYSAYLIALGEYNDEVQRLTAEYNVAMKLYNDKLSKYNDYKDTLERYEQDLEKYNIYVSELESYNIEYAKYLNYLKEKDEFADKIQAYEQYLEKMETVREQIAILDAIKTTSTSLKRDLYYSIMGSTVDSVLENRDLIANSATGVKPEIVDEAGDATENLRKHFKEYFALKTEAEKYNYYITNYRSIGENFASLLRTLDRLYQSKQVCSELRRQDKHDKYVILLAQLYYITNALNDTPVSFYDPVDDKYYKNNNVFDSEYRIWNITYNKNGTSPLDALEGVPLIEDKNNTTPLSGGYPTPIEEPTLVEVAEPTKPTPVKEPVKPTEVLEPVKPEEPDFGDAPDVVDEPIAPDEVEKPGEAPTPYEPTEQMLKFAQADIEMRTPLTKDYVHSPEITVRKGFMNQDEVTVVFYDADGQKLYASVIDKGSYAEYNGAIPTKAETDTEKYVFLGWTNTVGGSELVDLKEINSDIQLYPCYKTVPKHKVTFLDSEGEVIYITRVLDGKAVNYIGNPPQKAETDTEKYVFIGWAYSEDAGEPVSLGSIKEDVCLYPCYKVIQKHKVTFFDFDDTVLYEIIVENGEGVSYVGENPSREESPSASYSFMGWTAEKGSDVTADLESIDSNLSLYPIFSAIDKYYEVIFSVNGEETVLSVKYGDTPEFTSIPQKEETSTHYYVFSGWDKEIGAVTESVTYTAQFEEKYIVPYEDGTGADITVTDGDFTVDCTDSKDEKIEISQLVDRASQSGSVTLLLDEGLELKMSYSEVLACEDYGAKYISFARKELGNSAYAYTVSILNEENVEIADKISTSVKIPCATDDIDNLFLYSLRESVWERVNFTYDEGFVSFDTGAALDFKLCLEYEVSIIPSSDGIELTIDRFVFSPGELVSLGLNVPKGITVSAVYYIGTDGSRVAIEDQLFVMPSDTISLGVEYSFNKYTVSFVLDDGTIYSQSEYKYGDMPIVPLPPTKANNTVDGVRYSYKFLSWSSEIEAVTADAVYTAIFESEIVPERDKSGLQISESVLKKLVPIAMLGIIFVVVIIPVAILALVFTFSGPARVARKKKKTKK